MIAAEPHANTPRQSLLGGQPLGAFLALAAAAWHGFLISKATNDNYLHLTLAQQLLAGEWPVRDFFEHGWVLQYTLSAASQSLLGHRLFSEAVIVGVAWGVSTYLVFGLVRRLTGSTAAAALAAVLLIVSGARGYSYPKGIVYAGAAVLWWGYVTTPNRAKIVAFGAWAAIAFYWRPDHGVYVALAIALAAVTVHGLGWLTAQRCSLAAATMLALIAPFLLYVHATVGLPEYVQTGMVQAQVEHTTHGAHEWPLLRYAGHIVTIEPAQDYAPSISLRWSADSTTERRRELLARYALTPLSSVDDPITRVRMSEGSMSRVRELLNEPLVEDTAGIERSSATLSAASWPAWHRWSFDYAWLRVRLLPSLDAHARASEFTVALFYVLPILLIVAAPWLHGRLSEGMTAGRLVAFAAFAFVVDLGMLRSPFPARAADGVLLSAVIAGLVVAGSWRAAARTGAVGALLIRTGTAVLALLALVTVAGAGQFGDRVTWLAGQWSSLRLARGAWGEAYGELFSSPPMTYFYDRPAGVSVRLAAYVRECVPPSERLLVLWFAPEIYYHADRLMAQRHLVFPPAWAAVPHEQRMALEKVQRFSPPVALARRSALEPYARATYPQVVSYVEREYELADTVAEQGEEYLIFTRRDRRSVRMFGDQQWPCYTSEPSSWSRVGRSPS